jgi:beta-lactamase regulating signal transducer with metallopeptidase domain
MMRLVAHLDPGPVVLAVILGAAVQVTIVVVLAAVLARAAFKKRADARNALWLGVLVCVLLSPLIAALLDRSELALWRVALPVPSPRVEVGADETVSGTAVLEEDEPSRVGERFGVRPTSGGDAQIKVVAEAGVRGKSGTRGEALAGGLSLLWAAGVLVGLMRIAWGWRQLSVLSRGARPLEIAGRGPTLERVRAALRVPTLPTIEISAAARGPVAIGLFRPRVVLPEGMVESISESALRDVLVHECAHVLRRDVWVGVLQRVAGALFWPHPCVHYLNGQLTRACEEVCDNHVLRCGDPCGYARALVALYALCRPSGVTRPGIGLLGARWTLADRVAGLLDPGRTSLTRASFQMRVVLALALLVVVLSGASVRVGSQAPVDPPKTSQAVSKTAAQSAPNSDVWDVEGIVVDEQGLPVAGAVVRTMPVVDGPANVEVLTAADGSFHFTLMIRSPSGLVGLMALADGGARMGLDGSFDRRRSLQSKEPARIVLKPSRAVTVRVKDGTGAPVSGATVEAAETRFRIHATTDALGAATLRIPADARIDWVLGFKPKAGFDYFETYDLRMRREFRPLPDEVVLTLEATQGVRIKSVDSSGHPVPGVVIGPTALSRIGKKDRVRARLCTTASVVTDRRGVASFDWLPRGLGLTTFAIIPTVGYSCPDPLVYDPAGPAELTARMLRSTRLSGTVRLADGRPAPQIQIRADGWGHEGPPSGMPTTRTGADGRYALDVPPEEAYIMGVVDDAWAARSLMNVVVREGQPQNALDFTLDKGTLLRGQVTEGPDHRPCGGASVMLIEKGELLPTEFRGARGNRGQLMRATIATDALGRFHFRVGPGSYTVSSANGERQVLESVSVEVKQEPEIVCDVTLKVSTPETIFKGVVVEKTATGERPVPKVRIMAWPPGSSGGTTTDDQGRFEFMRQPGEMVLYAYSTEQGLGGFAPVSATADNGKILVSKAASVKGRVIDTSGKPQARHQVIIDVATSPLITSARFQIIVTCDEQGGFTFKGAPAGSNGELSARHEKDANGRLTRARTVIPFEVDGPETVEVPDLVVPAEKAARQ